MAEHAAPCAREAGPPAVLRRRALHCMSGTYLVCYVVPITARACCFAAAAVALPPLGITITLLPLVGSGCSAWLFAAACATCSACAELSKCWYRWCFKRHQALKAAHGTLPRCSCQRRPSIVFGWQQSDFVLAIHTAVTDPQQASRMHVYFTHFTRPRPFRHNAHPAWSSAVHAPA